MAEITKIAWCQSSWNGWIGCSKIAEECQFCYAAEMDSRKRWDGGRTHWGPGVPRYRTKPANWAKPRQWNEEQKKRIEAGVIEPWRVFGGSLMDWADNEVDPTWRAAYWRLIAETPLLTWLLLTKRAPNIERMLPPGFSRKTYPHVWLGTTAGTQKRVDVDGMRLLLTDAAVSFLSIEPQLEEVNLRAWLRAAHELQRRPWVIIGGESGRQARPFDIGWARIVLAQCREFGAPAFMKQIGARGFEARLAAARASDEPSDRLWFGGWTRVDKGGESRWVRQYRTKDPAGADPAEWPADICVREFPK